jgi:small subunit ribosomal protein S16
MTRIGRKKLPFYRIVAIDSRSPRDGEAIEILGYYNPKDHSQFKLNVERAEYWLGVGATPSETVGRLINKAKAGSQPAAS